MNYNKPLFTVNNKKIRKGEKNGVLTIVLHFAPHDISFNPSKYGFNDIPGIDTLPHGHPKQIKKTVCPYSVPECRDLCLYTAGNGSYPNVKRGRILKTQAFLMHPAEFIQRMKSEVLKYLVKARKLGMELAVRPNGTQDIPWELYEVDGSNFIEWLHSLGDDVKPYDYTKWTVARNGYHLTYSFTGSAKSKRFAISHLERGGNIAFVYDGAMPETWNGFPVVSGDNDDIRYNDPIGYAIGLKAKGKARGKASFSGFVQVYA